MMTNDELEKFAARYAEAWCSHDPLKFMKITLTMSGILIAAELFEALPLGICA